MLDLAIRGGDCRGASGDRQVECRREGRKDRVCRPREPIPVKTLSSQKLLKPHHAPLNFIQDASGVCVSTDDPRLKKLEQLSRF